MRNAVLTAGVVGALPDAPDHFAPVEAFDGEKEVASSEQAMVQLEHCAKMLDGLQRAHRKVTLSSVAVGAVSPDEVIARVDTVRRASSR